MSRRALASALVLLLVLTAPVSAAWPFSRGGDENAIRWLDDPQQALRLSAETGKPVLAYVTSSHCTYCRKMERQTWRDRAVADRVAIGFVPLKLTADDHPQEVEALGVRAFPTTVVLTPQGRGVAGATGFQSPEQLTELLRSARRDAAVAARPE